MASGFYLIVTQSECENKTVLFELVNAYVTYLWCIIVILLDITFFGYYGKICEEVMKLEIVNIVRIETR